METQLTTSNILARSIIQDLLHQALLRNSARRLSYQNSASSRSSTTLVSSSSSESFFDCVVQYADPDLPTYDRVFSSQASHRKPIFHSTSSLYGYGSPPSPTKKLCSEIQRVTYRRNAVVNQLQKTVTFPRIEVIKWPQAKFLTPEVGRQKIIEFIEKTWNYSPLLMYSVEFVGQTGYSQSHRLRYVCEWRSPSGKMSHVYFNIDTPKNNSERTVTVTYTFGNGKIVHKPHTSNYANRWLREIEKI